MTPRSFLASRSYGQEDRETDKKKKVTGDSDQGGHQATAHAEADTSDEPDISRVHAGLRFAGGEEEAARRDTPGEGWREAAGPGKRGKGGLGPQPRTPACPRVLPGDSRSAGVSGWHRPRRGDPPGRTDPRPRCAHTDTDTPAGARPSPQPRAAGTHTHTYTYIHTYIHTHVRMHTRVGARTRGSGHAHARAYLPAFTYVQAHITHTHIEHRGSPAPRPRHRGMDA